MYDMENEPFRNFESIKPIASQNDLLFCSKCHTLVTSAGQKGVNAPYSVQARMENIFLTNCNCFIESVKCY